MRTRSLGTREVRSFISDIDRFIAGELDNALEPEYTGYMPWVRATSDYVAEGQRTCFTWAFVAIAVMMILVLRSLRLGLISMLPNLVPVLLSLPWSFSGFLQSRTRLSPHHVDEPLSLRQRIWLECDVGGGSIRAFANGYLEAELATLTRDSDEHTLRAEIHEAYLTIDTDRLDVIAGLQQIR